MEPAFRHITVCGAALLIVARIAVLARAPSGERSQSSVAARPADLVLSGGKIVTMDDRRPLADALAVVGDTIAAVGSNQGKV